jgi:divalent metal cation (Fe/Co/Zn/Cd) transporter
VGQGHAAADAVESALERALPESDVVVHVEPVTAGSVAERVQAAALCVPGVREVHNIAVVDVDNRPDVSLHLKLPGAMSLDEAHAVATAVENAIHVAVPGAGTVQTHIEPLEEETVGRRAPASPVDDEVVRIVREVTGSAPRELRFVETDGKLVAYVKVGLDAGTPLADAHGQASEIEEQIRREQPQIADVVIHTEP